MATEVGSTELAQIGATAGLIWQYLSTHGGVSLTRLAKDIDAPRDLIMQGVGWLAREGKIRFDDNGRNRLLSLADQD